MSRPSSTRLRRAVAAMQSAIDELVATSRDFGAGEHHDVIETYRMFAADRGWLGRIADAVRSGLTAEAAVQKVRDETRTRMMQVSRPLSARAAVRSRRSRQPAAASSLPAGRRAPAWAELPPEFILVARAMGPAELLDYAHRRIRGLVLEEGSPTAHVAIVARAFDIPVVGRVEDATSRIEPGDIVIVDGDHAQVLIRPSDDIQQSVAAAVAERDPPPRLLRDAARSPAVTRDGVAIRLLLNAGLLIDLAQLAATGAEGVGLFRTEIPLMMRDAFPDVADQTEFYRRVFEQVGEPADRLPHARYRRRQGAALSEPHAPRTTRRWAGGRSASGSTARRCCASNCAR